MPTLVIEHLGVTRGGRLNGPLLIGRHSTNGLVVNEPRVSRVHAWVGVGDGAYFVADTGSRTGTLLNGRLVTGRQPLADGDAIGIGPATIRFRATDQLPNNVVPIELTSSMTPADVRDETVHVTCACGEGRRLSIAMLNRAPRCANCRAPVYVTPARPTPHAAGMTCGVCQTTIHPDDATTTCGGCELVYHAECWHENRGCAAYGCDRVNALVEPTADATSEGGASAPGEGVVAPGPPFPWDYVLLGGSVLAIPVGALAFGLPSLVVGGAAGLMMRHRAGRGRRSVLGLSAVLSILGAVAGVGISRVWWMGGGEL